MLAIHSARVLAMVTVVGVAGTASGQTVIVTQTVQTVETRVAIHADRTTQPMDWIVWPVPPAAYGTLPIPALQVNPVLPPPNIGPCGPGFGPNMVVVDERVFHTGSYHEVHLTGDVYTPSYLAARDAYETRSKNAAFRAQAAALNGSPTGRW